MILQFPFDGMIRWMRGVYTSLESMEIYNIGAQAKENITIIYIAPRSSSNFWSGVNWSGEEAFEDGAAAKGSPVVMRSISIGQFFGSLVRGEMVPFIQPDESVHRKVE